MLKNVQKKTKQVLKEDEVHYKSGYGFELYDPLPDSDEYETIKNKDQPWRTYDQDKVDEDPNVDYVSEDIVDKPPTTAADNIPPEVAEERDPSVVQPPN